MPVVGMRMGEGPSNPLEGETARDPWIFVDVLKVVQVDELVPKGLAEDNPDNCRQKHADDSGDEPLIGSSRTWRCDCATAQRFFPVRISHFEGD